VDLLRTSMVPKLSTKSRVARPRPTDPIGVFDSGIGGLSVLRELQRLMPGERFLFVADQRHVPYGGKTAAQLRRYTGAITRFLSARRCKIVVVACNTGTVYAIDHLRRTFDIPFVGTVPAIKPAVALSTTKVVAILSTPATAVSPALRRLVRLHARDARVLRIGCKGLEEMVERGSVSGSKTDDALRAHLAPAVRAGADVIVLGCTHYPFMRRRIGALSGARVIDSGRAIARRTRSLLKASGLLNPATLGSTRYYTNGAPADFSRVASKLLRRNIRSHHADV
jgi:glutamate racemase